MRRAFEGERGSFEFEPAMGEFGEAEFDEAEIDEAEFDEAELGDAEFDQSEMEWQPEIGRRRPTPAPLVRDHRQRVAQRRAAARPFRQSVRPRTWTRPFRTASRPRWPGRPATWSRPSATPYRWPARGAWPRTSSQYAYRFGQTPYASQASSQWATATPRWGYWDRWGRWRRRRPFGQTGQPGYLYAATSYGTEPPPFPEPFDSEPPIIEPVIAPMPVQTAEPQAAPQSPEPTGTGQAPAQDQPTEGEFAIEPEMFEFDPELDELEGPWAQGEGAFDKYEAPSPPKAATCPSYQRGEVEKSRTQQGHLPSDVISHARGLLIADFGVDWRTPKSALRNDPQLKSWVNTMIQIVAANPTTQISVKGFSDCVGRENNNRVLRLGRAQRVLKLLHQLAGPNWRILSPRIKAEAAPASDYVADNATVEGRAHNRGVLIEHTRTIDMKPTMVTGKKTISPFARAFEGPSSPLDIINKVFDAFTLVDIGLTIAGVAAAEGFMLAAGIVIAPFAPFVAMGAMHEAAINELKKKQMLEGLSLGIVLAADGRSNKWIIDHGYVKKAPVHNLVYPERGKELQQIYNTSLVAGIAHGRQFNTVATKNMFTFVTSQMTDYAKREYLGYPNTMTGDQWVAYSRTWSARKWDGYYRLVAAIVSRQIRFK